MTQKVTILYFIQLPPPVHGVSSVNEFVYHNAWINENIKKHLLEIKFSDDISELRRTTLRKIRHFFRLIQLLNKTLKQINPDYVYFSIMPVGKGFWRDLFFVRQIKKRGVRPIYHLHNRGIERRSGNFIFRKLYQYVFQDSIVIHLSENLLMQEISPLKIKNVQTAVIPNGVPKIDFKSREKPDSPTRLLFISNLFPSKGIYELLHIMKELRNQQANVRLQIAGTFWRSNYQKKMTGMIDNYRLNEVVSLVGPVFGDEKWKQYRDADVFIFPTQFKEECFPLVVLEAMQFGLPIIASNIGAIPEIIEHGVDGFLFHPEDLSGFVRAISELNDQKDKLKKMGLAARNKYMEHYTDAHLEKNIRDLYDNYLTYIR